MNAICEICQDAILQPTRFSTEANDYLIQVLEDNNDSQTAAKALIYNSRYNQLNREQRLRLLKLSLSNGYETIILSNYAYLSRARKYEMDYLVDNMDIEKAISIFKHYPKDYKESIMRRHRSEKLTSIFAMIQLMD